MNTPDNWKDERIRELTRLLEAVRDNENHLYTKIANLKAINEGLEEEIVVLHHRIGELERQNNADRQDFSAEIAALREAVRYAYYVGRNGVLMVEVCDERHSITTTDITESSMQAVRRALEGKP